MEETNTEDVTLPVRKPQQEVQPVEGPPKSILEVEMSDGSIHKLEVYDDFSEEEMLTLAQEHMSSFIPEEDMPKGDYQMDNTKFTNMVPPLLKAEGGFVNNPKDKGGATKYGITRKTLSAWRGEEASVDDVKALTQEEAIEIYKNEYYLKPKINQIGHEKVEEMVLDHGINAGPAAGVKLLQRVIGAKQDGGLGPNSLKKLEEYIKEHGEDEFIRDYARKRKQFYLDVIKNNPDNLEFKKGWFNRVDNMEKRLLAPVVDDQNTPAPEVVTNPQPNS